MFAQKPKAILDFLEEKNIRVVEAASCNEKSITCSIATIDVKCILLKYKDKMESKFDIRIITGSMSPLNVTQLVTFESKKLRKI